jgi:hypothetical protein
MTPQRIDDELVLEYIAECREHRLVDLHLPAEPNQQGTVRRHRDATSRVGIA